MIDEHPGPIPPNIYNKGFFSNLYQAVFPPSIALLAAMRREEEELARAAEERRKKRKKKAA